MYFIFLCFLVSGEEWLRGAGRGAWQETAQKGVALCSLRTTLWPYRNWKKTCSFPWQEPNSAASTADEANMLRTRLWGSRSTYSLWTSHEGVQPLSFHENTRTDTHPEVAKFMQELSQSSSYFCRQGSYNCSQNGAWYRTETFRTLKFYAHIDWHSTRHEMNWRTKLPDMCWKVLLLKSSRRVWTWHFPLVFWVLGATLFMPG